jgi:hypothetical protein
MNLKNLSKNGLIILINKHMTQSQSAMERGDKEAHTNHEKAAKLISAELSKR